MSDSDSERIAKQNERSALNREAVMRRKCDRAQKRERKYALALHAIREIVVDDGRKVSELRTAYLATRKIVREALDETGEEGE